MDNIEMLKEAFRDDVEDETPDAPAEDTPVMDIKPVTVALADIRAKLAAVIELLTPTPEPEPEPEPEPPEETPEEETKVEVEEKEEE